MRFGVLAGVLAMVPFLSLQAWAEPSDVPSLASDRPSEDATAPFLESAGKLLCYDGDGGDLQDVMDRAPEGATIVVDRARQYTFREPLNVKKPLTLRGLNARLPEGLGKTSLIVVTADNVGLLELELHGNYSSVDQKSRAPLIAMHGSRFRVENCTFFDGTKDGVMIVPPTPTGSITGGVVRNIQAFRMGRDAVSISGGSHGGMVRDLLVENVMLTVGYLRGPVEVSDGTDNIRVRNVYAEKCLYALDVQDHRGESAPNTNVVAENLQAADCHHIVRTANSPRGHRDLVLRNLVGIRCEQPMLIKNTKNVAVENLLISGRCQDGFKPIQLVNCQAVRFTALRIDDAALNEDPIASEACSDIEIEGVPYCVNQR